MLVLVGFMGAGKSSGLRSIAAEVGQTVDVDAAIEASRGEPIAAIFERDGEAEFRRIEEEAVLAALARPEVGAVALGGGALGSAAVREALAAHTTVWLDVGEEAAWSRATGRGNRPLATDRDRFARLWAERRATYEAAADAVLPEGDRETLARALPSIRALAGLPPGTRLIWATGSSGEHPVFVGRGLLGAAPWPRDSRRFLVTDSGVGPLHAECLGPVEATIEVPPGEGSKTMAEAERVLRDLARAGMRRGDTVVALGGGVVGDLAGFCAATYQRGVDVVQVPTSLVAQVDSAYGGKTGVDLPEGKNYVGSFHLPAAVITDTEALATLPREELAAGFVEALKTGLLAGGRLWDAVRGLERLDPGTLDEIVFACARYKCGIVAADERESGLRAVLNLGHTVGHAIEAATGYRRYRHGEAIGLGLLAALRLSEADELRVEAAEVLARHALPVTLDRDVAIEPVIEALGRDKKRTADGVGFVLLREPGQPLIDQRVEPGRVREAVEELYQ